MRQETAGLLPFLPGRGLSWHGPFLPALLPPRSSRGRPLPARRPAPSLPPPPSRRPRPRAPDAAGREGGRADRAAPSLRRPSVLSRQAGHLRARVTSALRLTAWGSPAEDARLGALKARVSTEWARGVMSCGRTWTPRAFPPGVPPPGRGRAVLRGAGQCAAGGQVRVRQVRAARASRAGDDPGRPLQC